MVNRGKYSLYDCHAIGTQARESSIRERELRTAIEKASRGPGGEPSSSIPSTGPNI